MAWSTDRWRRELRSLLRFGGLCLIINVTICAAAISAALAVFMVSEWPPGSPAGGAVVGLVWAASLGLTALLAWAGLQFWRRTAPPAISN